MAALCPSVLNQGFCLNNQCQLQHDTSNFCMICNLDFLTPAAYNTHIQTPAHSQAQNASQWLHCVPCNSYYIQGTIQQTSHENSVRHGRRVTAHNAGPPVAPIAAPPGSIRCDVCNITVVSAAYDEHCRGNRHTRRRLVRDYGSALNRTQGNRRGVQVLGPESLDFGAHPPAPALNVPPIALQISYVGQNPAGVSLIHARASSSVGAPPGSQLRFTVTTTAALPLPIMPQAVVEVQIHFNPHGQRGRFEDRLELIFQEPDGNGNNVNFAITRPLKAIIGNADIATLAPTTPYRRPRRPNPQGTQTQVIYGADELEALRPPPVTYRPDRRLVAVGFPDNMEAVLHQGTLEEKIQAFGEEFMPDTLDFASFQQYWSNLVHAENIQARIELTRFDMNGVNLAPVGRLYELHVPGLAEKRPSVMKRDWIMVHPQTEEEGVWFRGVVHEVQAASVRIKFPARFPYAPGARYDVRFTLNPVPFRRMLQALSINPKRSDVLFPHPEDIPPGTAAPGPANEPGIQLHNNAIGTNAEQLQAVRRVVELPLGSPPFIVYGPPGTGKTVTVVECISQILNADKNNQILACAPSNPASDLIAMRLIAQGIGSDRLFRLNAIWRPQITLPDELTEYSLHQNGTFKVPAQSQLDSYQIVVATCSSAAMLYGVGVDPGSFTHIFVDEAGQGSEPEVMIPILTMAGPKTNIILSGDPQQLGPVVQSPIAKPLGMETSYLARLMARPAYDEQTMRGISFAKLLQNFRSHASILAFPNQQFYGNELTPHAPANIANTFLNWGGLGTPGFPVVFEAVAGEDMQEGTSPSYFNPHEASIVNAYVQELLPLIESPRDIGIIAPYKGQVRKIRQLLKENNVTDIEIGSVEQFQGQERKVIIVSTVRSNRDRLSYDLRHTLGFVANRQRLNVAITRAQSLLIVVGDPQVLGLDVLWRRFLYYIHASGGWKGGPFPWDPDANPDDAGETAELAEQETLDILRRTILDGPAANDDADELDQAGNPDA